MSVPAGMMATMFEPGFFAAGAVQAVFDDRFRADLSWANIVVDGRRPVDLREAPLTDDLPVAGILTDEHESTGVVEVPYAPPTGTHGTLTVSLHPHLEADWGSMIARFVYPDGFIAASVVGDLGHSDKDINSVWQAFMSAPTSAVNRAFCPLDNLWKVTPEDVASALGAAAYALREAAHDPLGWYAPADLPATESDGTITTDTVTIAAREIVTVTALGLTSRTPALLLFAEGVVHDDVMAARDGGFDVTKAEDRDWVIAVASHEWAYAHTDWWADIHALRQQGWTLGALAPLHPAALVNRLSKELSDHEGRYVGDTPWRDAVRLEEWVHVTGSPAMASACLEAGLGLDETVEMLGEGQRLDYPTLEMMAALRRTPSSDRIR